MVVSTGVRVASPYLAAAKTAAPPASVSLPEQEASSASPSRVKRAVWLTAGACALLGTVVPTAFPATAAAATQATPSKPAPHVEVLYVPLTQPPATMNLVQKELVKPTQSGEVPTFDVIQPSLGNGGTSNPFGLTPKDFNTGRYLMLPGETTGPVPGISASDAKWFDSVVKTGQLPDVFVIGGHHVISEGYHNHQETMFLFEPTLLQTLHNDANARKVFGNVKFAILWGCNTMTDLEPHGPNGEYLSPQQIKDLYDQGPAGRRAVLGTADQTNTHEFYLSRLAREYGPNTGQYEYTRSESKEVCEDKVGHQGCEVTNLERIMPKEGLWDGTHRYNQPEIAKEEFPNAYLVLGYSSASPSEPQRGAIFAETLRRSYQDLKPYHVTNIIETIVDPSTPPDLRKTVIESVRKNWTQVTYSMNRGRPSGSITPALPQLDKNGIFNVSVAGSKDTPLYAPYEDRGSH